MYHNLYASLALGVSVLAIAATPQIASAQTNISDVDYQIAVNKAEHDLDRICVELDGHQATYDKWQQQVEENTKLDHKLNDDVSELDKNVFKRIGEVLDAGYSAADTRRRLDRINRIQALIKERISDEGLENAKKGWALSADEFRVVMALRWAKSDKARAKANLEKLKNNRPGQSDIITTGPGKKPDPDAPFNPEVAIADIDKFIREYDFRRTPDSPNYADWTKQQTVIAEDEKWSDYLKETETQILCADEYFSILSTAGEHELKFGYDTFTDIRFSCNHTGDNPYQNWRDDAADVSRPPNNATTNNTAPRVVNPDGTINLDALNRILEQAAAGRPAQAPNQGGATATSGRAGSASSSATADDAAVGDSARTGDGDSAPVRADADAEPQ